METFYFLISVLFFSITIAHYAKVEKLLEKIEKHLSRK